MDATSSGLFLYKNSKILRMNQARRFPVPINFRDLTIPTHGLERSYTNGPNY